MAEKEKEPIRFELDPQTAKAIELLAGKREVRAACRIHNGVLEVECLNFGDSNLDQFFPGSAFIALNAPFKVNSR